jgi:hypothetical protein
MSAAQLRFVNASGQPLDIASLIAQQPKKTRPSNADTESRHFGFAVTGFSPQQIASAQAAHAARRELSPDLGAFSPDEWMNGGKGGGRPSKAAHKPFATPAGAELCADMVRKAGWLRVQIVEVIR